MVEKYPCKDKLESDKREREILERLGATLNKNIPNRTYKEWCKNNKEKLTGYGKEYRKNNIDKLTGYGKEYYKNNKEKLSIKQKEYQEEYRKNNKEKIKKYNTKLYTCITCNTTINLGSKSTHKKSKKHLQNLNA